MAEYLYQKVVDRANEFLDKAIKPENQNDEDIIILRKALIEDVESCENEAAANKFLITIMIKFIRETFIQKG